MANLRNDETFLRFLAFLGETGLEPQVRGICLAHSVSLREVYLDFRGASVHAARQEIWFWLLHEMGRSPNEVARIFDRDRSSLIHVTKRLKEKAVSLGRPLDMTTVRELASAVAADAREVRERVGREMSERKRGG